MNRLNKTEGRIQQEIVRWYRNEYCLKHHNPRSLIMSIPNNKNPLLKEVGMMSGASDLLMVHRWRPKFGRKPVAVIVEIYFVEVKRPGKKQQKNQVVFQKHIEQMGMNYVVVESLDEFKELVL